MMGQPKGTRGDSPVAFSRKACYFACRGRRFCAFSFLVMLFVAEGALPFTLSHSHKAIVTGSLAATASSPQRREIMNT